MHENADQLLALQISKTNSYVCFFLVKTDPTDTMKITRTVP